MVGKLAIIVWLINNKVLCLFTSSMNSGSSKQAQQIALDTHDFYSEVNGHMEYSRLMCIMNATWENGGNNPSVRSLLTTTCQ